MPVDYLNEGDSVLLPPAPAGGGGMRGILDDPYRQGLLQAAFAMLNASGPSRTPVGIGQVIGQGGMAGLKGVQEAQAAETRKLQARKLAAEVKMQEDLAAGNSALATGDPDRLEAVGMRLAAGGHPGGSAFVAQAEKIRARQDAEKRIAGFKTSESTDEADIASAAGQGAPIPKTGGLFASLMTSPYVGEDAKRLQAQLDREGKGAKPDDYLKRLDALAAAHRAAAEKDADRAQRDLNLPKSMVLVQDKNSPTGWSHRDTRTNQTIVGAPPPANTGAAALGDIVPPQHKDLHGDDYLGTLPTGMGQMVKAIAEGKIDPSKAASLRYGNREAIMQRVMQYDPKYNQTRPKVYADFTTGKSAQNITAMNTVVAHMGTVMELSEAQKNGNVQTVNAILNRARTEFGNPAINNTEIAVQAMGNELMRVFRQVGAAQHEVEAWEKKFNAAKGSPEQLRGALKVGAELLKGRLDAVNDQWKRGMDTDKDFPILSEKSKAALSRIGVIGAGIPLPQGEGAPKPAAQGGNWTPEKEQRYQELLRKRGGS